LAPATLLLPIAEPASVADTASGAGPGVSPAVAAATAAGLACMPAGRSAVRGADGVSGADGVRGADEVSMGASMPKAWAAVGRLARPLGGAVPRADSGSGALTAA
jgi:hypothetical protein